LGINSVNSNTEAYLRTNSHHACIKDDIRLRLNSYLSTDLIPEKYRRDKDYYNNYNPKCDTIKLKKENSSFKELSELTLKCDLSPILAETKELEGLPKGFFKV
jgi:hypothetical protein